MQQRYYDPIAGRFLSVDPVVTDTNTGSSFNRYVYGTNNLYGHVDPDGRESVSIEGYLGVGGGITVGYDFQKGEFAVTLAAGIGLGGGGFSPDSSNERAKPDGGGQATAGGVINAFSKVSAGISTPLGSAGGELKVVGGKDFGEGKPVGGLDNSATLSKPGPGRVEPGLAAGVEGSVYVKPAAAANSIAWAVRSAVGEAKDSFQRNVMGPAIRFSTQGSR